MKEDTIVVENEDQLHQIIGSKWKYIEIEDVSLSKPIMIEQDFINLSGKIIINSDINAIIIGSDVRYCQLQELVITVNPQVNYTKTLINILDNTYYDAYISIINCALNGNSGRGIFVGANNTLISGNLIRNFSSGNGIVCNSKFCKFMMNTVLSKEFPNTPTDDPQFRERKENER